MVLDTDEMMLGDVEEAACSSISLFAGGFTAVGVYKFTVTRDPLVKVNVEVDVMTGL